MINFLVALACEAKPLISAFKLKRLHQIKAVTVYENLPYRLAVTGIGKLAAAGSVGLLQGLQNEQQAWLNVGIAGHGHLDIGTATLAYKIIDAATQDSWYPQILFQHNFQAATVKTIDMARDQYDELALFDMEAAGIASMVARVSTMELFQSIKIISDNKQHDHSKVGKLQCVQLVEQHLDSIAEVSQYLLQQQQSLEEWNKPPAIFATILEKWHFSASEQHQLLKDLNKLKLDPEKTQVLLACQDGKQLMTELSEQLKLQHK